jgi:hypothetical protein
MAPHGADRRNGGGADQWVKGGAGFRRESMISKPCGATFRRLADAGIAPICPHFPSCSDPATIGRDAGKSGNMGASLVSYRYRIGPINVAHPVRRHRHLPRRLVAARLAQLQDELLGVVRNLNRAQDLLFSFSLLRSVSHQRAQALNRSSTASSRGPGRSLYYAPAGMRAPIPTPTTVPPHESHRRSEQDKRGDKADRAGRPGREVYKDDAGYNRRASPHP